MRERIGPARLALLLLLLIPVAYGLTLARSVVYGDPTEYTFVAHILGIAHPPGYAFFTLLGKLFQTILPVGEIAWRMHLLAATAATVAALFVFGTVRPASRPLFTPVGAQTESSGWRWVADAFAALRVASVINF